MLIRREGARGGGLPAAPALAVALLALLGLLAAPGCGGPDAPPANAGQATPASQTADEGEDDAKDDAIAVEIGPVVRQTLSELYATSATLRADARATITARTRGVIEELLVEEGDWVQRGQPLARLEDDEQRIAFEQARAASNTRRRELERAEALHAQGLLADEAFETTRRQAVDAAHTADLNELTLSRTVIRAPFDGRILTRHLDPGATVSDGTAVYDVADLDPLYADVQVPERQVARLRPDQTVRIATEQNGAKPVTIARIDRIAPLVDPETGTVKVTVAVDRAEGLRPGSFVRVGMVTDTHQDALVVPRSALVAEGRRWHLFRVKPDAPDKVELVEVQRGFEEADRVEILATEGSAPLREGDRVVVTGASSLSDGSVIQAMGPSAEQSQQEAADADPSRDDTTEGAGVAT